MLEEETLEWHQVIVYKFEIQKRKRMRTISNIKETACGGWRTTTDAINNFETYFHKIVKEMEAGRSLNSETFTEYVTDACNQVFKKKRRYLKGKRGAYWWNDEIKEVRKECLAKRRRLVRINRHGTQQERDKALQEYKHHRRMLKHKIMASKRQAWMDLLSALDNDQWG